MVSTALEGHGLIKTEREVAMDSRRIDVSFSPTGRQAALPDHLGLLGQILRRPCTMEFHHKTPNREVLTGCVIKHGDFLHLLSLDEKHVPLPRGRRPRIPTLWVVSAGCPKDGIKGLWLRPSEHWPSGIYDAAPLLWTQLVVVSELPVERSTLLLRLLGAKAVLRRALAELDALPEDAPERLLALPILLRLRLALPTNPAEQTSDDQEFLMQTQDIVETWRQKAIQEGIARSLIDFYEARFGAMPDDLRGIIEDTHDEATLRGWVKLAGTRSADEVAAAIRASRPA
jgi:hypothetical protein